MSSPIYYPNRDTLGPNAPANWTLLKRLTWVYITRRGEQTPDSDVVNVGRVDYMILTT